jgi:hypothetical protein
LAYAHIFSKFEKLRRFLPFFSFSIIVNKKTHIFCDLNKNEFKSKRKTNKILSSFSDVLPVKWRFKVKISGLARKLKKNRPDGQSEKRYQKHVFPTHIVFEITKFWYMLIYTIIEIGMNINNCVHFKTHLLGQQYRMCSQAIKFVYHPGILRRIAY